MMRLEDRLRQILTTRDPWTNVYGLARTLLALSCAFTLAWNPADYLFRPAAGMDDYPPMCGSVTQYTFYCLGGDGFIGLKTGLAIVFFVIIASGWRPRYTGILQWYLTFSYHSSTMLVEGGDQVASITLLLLIPVTLMDGRRWHWTRPTTGTTPTENMLKRRLYAWAFILAIKVQISFIYLHGFYGKIGKEHWADGSAVFYWFRNPTFGAPGWLAPITDWLIDTPLTLATMTWGTLFIEWLLAAAIFMNRSYRRIMLWMGFALHTGFALVFGLPSFSTIMFAALLIYLIDPDEHLAFLDKLGVKIRRRLAKADLDGHASHLESI